MNSTDILGRLLNLEEAQRIEQAQPSLAAGWVHDAPAWLLFGCLAMVAVVAIFYFRYQTARRAGARLILVCLRAAALCLLLLLLAEPILSVKLTSKVRPAFWMLFDGTDSMGISDELSETDREQLVKAAGMEDKKKPGASPVRLSRADYIKAFVQRKEDNLLEKLAEDFRLRAFLFDRPEGVRSLELSTSSRATVEPAHLAQQLTTDGAVTALGAAL